jgi:hypothetical protein
MSPAPSGRSGRCALVAPDVARTFDARPCHEMEYLFLIAGLVIGVVFGLIVVAMAAIGSYDRGYSDALMHRPQSS